MTLVYAKYRPDGTPLYVGEGGPQRLKQHQAATRSSSVYLYRHVREMHARGELIRDRILFEGLAKSRAKQLEVALIREFGAAAILNRNGRFADPSPEAVTYVRRRKHLWRLPAITRIRVSWAARATAHRALNHPVPVHLTPKGGSYVWLEGPQVVALDALKGPGDSYSDVILRLAAERG